MILRRRRLWFGVLLVGLVLAGGVWWWAGSTALWCRDIDRIKEGMAREEVLRVLGGSPRQRMPNFLASDLDIKTIDQWVVADGIFHIGYDANDRVVIREALERDFFSWQWQLLNNRLFPPPLPHTYLAPPHSIGE